MSSPPMRIHVVYNSSGEFAEVYTRRIPVAGDWVRLGIDWREVKGVLLNTFQNPKMAVSINPAAWVYVLTGEIAMQRNTRRS